MFKMFDNFSMNLENNNWKRIELKKLLSSAVLCLRIAHGAGRASIKEGLCDKYVVISTMLYLELLKDI